MVPAFLLAANLAYFLTAHTSAARVVSAVGTLAALLLVVAARVPAMARRIDRELPRPRSAAFVGSVVAFAAPLLATIRPVRLVFVTLDARLLLVSAWLATVSLFLTAASDGRSTASARGTLVRRRPVLTVLFVFWSALFWLMLVWDVGVGAVVTGRLQEDRLSMSFRIWEARPASEHLFLVWMTPEAFARGEAYSNHLHPYLFLMYGGAKVAELLTALPLTVGRNLMMFSWPLLGAGVLAAWLLRSGHSPRVGPLKLYATLFVMVGLLVTESHYWRYVYVTNLDTVFPALVYLAALIWVATLPRASGAGGRFLVASTTLFALFGPAYLPIVLVALWCCRARMQPTLAGTLSRNRGLARASLVSLAVGAIAYSLPLGLILWKGYSNLSSPVTFRTGLDGDTQYFHDAVQAVFRPYWGEPRSLLTLLVPAYVPLAACALLSFGKRSAAWRRWLAAFAFLITQYLFSLVLFPQAVAIHPYLYDQLLFLPAVFLAGVWAATTSFQQRLRGPVLLLTGFLASGLLMWNLITVAQVMRGLPRTPVAEAQARAPGLAP